MKSKTKARRLPSVAHSAAKATKHTQQSPQRLQASRGAERVGAYSERSQFTVQEVARRTGSNVLSHECSHEYLDWVANAYQEATGEVPNDIRAIDRAVLVETGVPGNYEDFPNGYVVILIARTLDGWLIFDTGQTPRRSGQEQESSGRTGPILFGRTGPDSEDLQRGIRNLISLLRRLH